MVDQSILSIYQSESFSIYSTFWLGPVVQFRKSRSFRIWQGRGGKNTEEERVEGTYISLMVLQQQQQQKKRYRVSYD
jgi:hypothetical protein